MTPPKRPTKEAKPLGRHPHAGQLAVVVSFRVDPTNDKVNPADLEADIGYALDDIGYHLADLSVAVRVIGAGGEASEREDVVGPLARTEDDVTVERAPLRETINPGDRL